MEADTGGGIELKKITEETTTGFGGAVRRREPADLVLIGVPYDEKSSYLRGAAEGPRAIRAAADGAAVNPWTETGVDLSRDTVLADGGDIDVRGSFADVALRIEAAVRSAADPGGIPFVMGGDHSVTPPVVRALARIHGQLDILHFDAHPDLYDEYEGDRFSHACPFARILEEGLAASLTQIGIRAAEPHQRNLAARHGVRMIEMRGFTGRERLRFERPIYLSFDIDALDPVFAPGVSHREPGGLTTREAVRLIHGIEGRIVGMDLVEVNPSRDPVGLTAEAAAKLMMEVMGKAVLSGRSRDHSPD